MKICKFIACVLLYVWPTSLPAQDDGGPAPAAVEAFRQEVLRRMPAHLPALRAELDRLRGAALGLIFSTTAYPEEDHGKAGQPKVDEAGAAVRALWENPLPLILSRDPAMKKRAEELQIAAPSPPADETARLRPLLPPDPEAVRKLWATPLNAREKAWAEWNERVAAANAKASDISEPCREEVRLLNAYRVMMGVQAVEIDPRLCRAAAKHAGSMRGAGKLWHDGPDGTPADRMRREGYVATFTGENVANGVRMPEEAHGALMNSSGHHRNMLSSLWTQTGAGEAEGYWTQDFGNGKPAAGNPPPRLPFAADKTGR